MLLAAQDAQSQGLAICTLVGKGEAIVRIAAEAGIDLAGMTIVDEPDPLSAAHKVMSLVGQGEADVAMKGRVETGDFLRAALDRDAGMRTGRLLTHVGVFEIPGFDRLIFISDAGVVVAPTMEQKVAIIENAVAVARALGIELPARRRSGGYRDGQPQDSQHDGSGQPG